MSRKHHVRPSRRAAATPGHWPVARLVLGGLAVIAAGLMLAQIVASRGAGSAGAVAEVQARGAESAPVVLTEWGDFQ